MDWGIDVKFLLMNPSLLFALLTILLMCGFQERLFDVSMPRCVVTCNALSVSLCIVYGLSMGDFDLVIFHIWRGWKSVAKIVPSLLVCQCHDVDCLGWCDYWFFGRALCRWRKVWGRFLEICGWACHLYREERGGSQEQYPVGLQSSRVPDPTCTLLPALVEFYWSENC